MKARSYIILTLLIFLIFTAVSFAGDVPESLLSEDNSMTFIGKVKEVKEDKLVVYQKYNFKGHFKKNKKISFDYDGENNPPYIEPGQDILIGYVDDSKLYTYEIEGFDGEKIRLAQDYEMTKRLEKYINDGSFARAEEERLEKQDKQIKEINEKMGNIDIEAYTVNNKPPTEKKGIISIAGLFLAIVILFIFKYKKNKR